MTDDRTDACANGCTYIKPGGSREPQRAQIGHLCQGCVDRLDHWLEEIPERYALVPTYLLPSVEIDENPTGGKKSKSSTVPAPIRLAALDLLDERRGRKWLGTIPADERRGTLGTLLAIGNEIRDLRSTPQLITSYVAQETTFIRGGLDILAKSDGITETYQEVRTLHHQLGEAIGVFPPRPVGRCTVIPAGREHTPQTCPCDCLTHGPACEKDCHIAWTKANQCSGPLLPQTSAGPAATSVICVRCGTRWDPSQLRLLGLTLGSVAS